MGLAVANMRFCIIISFVLSHLYAVCCCMGMVTNTLTHTLKKIYWKKSSLLVFVTNWIVVVQGVHASSWHHFSANWPMDQNFLTTPRTSDTYHHDQYHGPWLHAIPNTYFKNLVVEMCGPCAYLNISFFCYAWLLILRFYLSRILTRMIKSGKLWSKTPT